MIAIILYLLYHMSIHRPGHCRDKITNMEQKKTVSHGAGLINQLSLRKHFQRDRDIFLYISLEKTVFQRKIFSLLYFS